MIDVRTLRYGPFQLLLAIGAIGSSLALLASPYARWSFLPGLAIAALLALSTRPRLGYYLFIFLIPFEFLTRLSETHRLFSVPKALGAWIALVVLLTLLLERGRASTLRSGLWLPIGLFLAVNVCAAALSPFGAVAADHLRKLLVAVTVFGLTLFFVDRRGFRDTLPMVLIGSILANYTLFVLEFVFDVSIGWGSEPIFPKGVGQPAYALPTGYSAYFVLLLPLVAYRFFQARTVTRRVSWLAVAGVSVGAIVYLGSRAAALTFLLTVALLFAQYLELFRPRFLGLLAGLAMLGAAAVIVLTPAAYWTRQKGVVEYETDPSVSRRVSYLQAAWESFRERPLLGAGPGTYSQLYARSLQGAQFGNPESDFRRDAHNTYVEVLIGSGIAGLACFVALVARALANFRGAVRRFKEAGDRADELLTRAYLIVLVATLVFLLFISNLYMKYFWILFALSELAARFSRRRAPEAGLAVDAAP